jgi:hypothetical protein
MSPPINELETSTTQSAKRTPPTGSRFFLTCATLLALLVFLGFAPTLYLRNIFAPLPPNLNNLPTYAWVHGIALSAWFLLYLTQAWLIRLGRSKLHRSLGIAALLLVPLVVVTTYLLMQRSLAQPIRFSPVDNPIAYFGSILDLIRFAGCIAVGLYFRSRPDFHKRLMLLGSASLIPPAVQRLPLTAAFPPLGIISAWLFVIALVVYDYKTQRKLHPVTLWAGVVAHFAMIPPTLWLGFSELGASVVRSMM